MKPESLLIYDEYITVHNSCLEGILKITILNDTEIFGSLFLSMGVWHMLLCCNQRQTAERSDLWKTGFNTLPTAKPNGKNLFIWSVRMLCQNPVWTETTLMGEIRKLIFVLVCKIYVNKCMLLRSFYISFVWECETCGCLWLNSVYWFSV